MNDGSPAVDSAVVSGVDESSGWRHDLATTTTTTTAAPVDTGAAGDNGGVMSSSSAASSSSVDANGSAATGWKSMWKKNKKRDKPGPPAVPFYNLFRFTTPTEKAMMAFSSLCAAIHGALLPLWTIVFGDVISAFSDDSVTEDELVSKIGGISKWFLVLAAVAFIMSFFQVQMQMIVAQRTSARIRQLYLRSLLRQDFEWYDAEASGELTARASGDVDLIHKGIGDKVGSAVQFISAFVVGIIIAFFFSWKMTLVILAITPFLALCGAIFAKLTSDSTSEGLSSYGAAGAVASEVLSLIRTVSAYGGQEEEARRYEKQLDSAYTAGIRKGLFTGLGFGVTMFLLFCAYALSFWYGAKLIRENSMDITDLFVAYFCVLIGAMSLGQAAPSFSAFGVARGAAPRVYEIIDRQSPIDPLSDEGVIPDSIKGDLAFEDVEFTYKSRQSEGVPAVLSNLSLKVNVGTTHALVGHSGCGKSSTMGLIERFYDVQSGRVTLDGLDIRTLNVQWLRSQMGYVGQMPILFRATIRDNIAFGAAMELEKEAADKGGGERYVLRRKPVSDNEIIEAAKLANAHNFIKKLPEGYDTLIGERGAMLSGGQKQRICIARAIVRNPKILLLDEATSALDAQSERLVQEALERASQGRTTVVIAHRLSTVRNADKISVFSNGRIVEEGCHSDLLQRQEGVYKNLVELQNLPSQQSDGAERMAEDAANDDDVVQMSPINAKSVTVDGRSITQTGVDSTEGKIVGVGVEEEQDDQDNLPATDPKVFARAFRIVRGDWFFLVIGIIGATIAGAAWPLSAWVFSEVTDVLGDKDNESEVVKWSLVYIAIGVATLVGHTLQVGMLGVSGERLTRRMRAQAFRALLRQEMGFFDRKENSVGALSAKLASEASLVKGICGDTLGAAALTLSTIGVGFGVAFAGCWRLALVVLCIMPFMVIGSVYQNKMMTGFDADSQKEFAQAGAVANEAVDGIRTITGLGIQDVFLDRYEQALQQPIVNGRKAAFGTGIAFGFAEASIFGLWAVAFWVGSAFIKEGWCDFLGIMKAVTGLLFAGFSLGNVSIFIPDVGSAKVAATQIFRLLDRQSEIDPNSPDGVQLASINGNVTIQDAEFEYPSRRDVAVLRGLSIGVSSGKTLALVGESGCGKSTVVALLERFYDLRNGSVKIDNTELKEMNLQNARSHLALVQQEPDLFNRTVRENIAYGLDKTDGTPVTDEQIVEAAKAANAHEFIAELPQGYDTPVGERGGSLSGGQRQRVAIARSLVRRPRVLLLDEATSALDAQSERVVQDALDDAQMGRTTIVIAHRLSTVKDADAIAVVKRGKIAELGTHTELMNRRGVYAALVRNQLSDQAR